MIDYLKRLEVELIMDGYHDGWYKKWLIDKINQIKSRNDGRSKKSS
jgi:hypothetical protein